MSELLKDALRLADRREHLGKNAKPCPACGTNQVQLINHFVVPAEWRCRRCRVKYSFEPDKKG